MIEKILAGAIAAACVLMLLRLSLGDLRRRRLDAGIKRTWWSCRRAASKIWNWRSSRRHAARVADEAIRRARGKVERDGNVYKPKSFRRPRKPH